MSKKSKTQAGSPVFLPRRSATLDFATGHGAAELAEILHSEKGLGARQLLDANITRMRVGAEKALKLPDTYNTHEPARYLLGKLETLRAAIDGDDDIVQLVHDAMMATQEFDKLRSNATLAKPVNQVRDQITNLARNRHKGNAACSESEIDNALRKGLSVKLEMGMLGVKRSTINSYRRKHRSPKLK